MSGRYFALVSKKYDKIRTESELEALRRKEELYRVIPELPELDLKINAVGINWNKKLLNGECSPDDASKQIREEIGRLKARKQQLLSERNLPQNILEPRYSCDNCKDTGLIGSDRCSCFAKMLTLALNEISNVGNSTEECWENFDEQLYPDSANKSKYGISASPRENILKIRERCLRFIDNFDDPNERNMLFHGHTGTGKTFAAKSTARSLIAKGRTVLYKSAPELFEEITRHKSRIFSEGDFEDPAYEFIYDCELFIVDDLGTESATPARTTELLNILNTRENSGKTRTCKTIISTNISIAKLLEYYNERIGSRIIGSFDIMMFAGDDIRVERAVRS